MLPPTDSGDRVDDCRTARAQAYRLHKQIGTILRVANQNAVDVFNQMMQDTFGEGHVTTTQFAVLSTLWQYGPMAHTQIAAKTAMDLPTLHSVVQRLVKKQLVTCRNDASDRRRRIVSLTSPGEALAFQLRIIGTSISAEILRPLSLEEQQQFLALLEKFNSARRSLPSD